MSNQEYYLACFRLFNEANDTKTGELNKEQFKNFTIAFANAQGVDTTIQDEVYLDEYISEAFE